MAANHPIIDIQNLIDELKECVRPVDTEHPEELTALWNRLEDLLLMLASSDKAEGKIEVSERAYSTVVRKSANYDKIESIVNKQKGKTDVDTDKEAG